jgi:general secretion pathway protein A
MYEEFYKFSGKPFQLTPDQRFFFNSRVHGRAMSYLRYGLEQGEGFIVITGGVGTGKTLLVRNLFSELDARRVLAAQLVNTQVEPEDMLRMVCASFGLEHEAIGKAILLQRLQTFARARHGEGKRVLLVVDEAQNLPPRSVEELRMLSNFQVANRSLFQSFLLGQEEFRQTLRAPDLEQMRQRVIASCHLDPLDLEDTRHYIEYRLTQVGWQGDPVLTAEVYAGVHAFTNGVPRRINNLCDRLLLFGGLEERHQLDQEALATVIAELRGEAAGSAAGPATPPRPVLEHDDDPDLTRRVAALERELARLQRAFRQALQQLDEEHDGEHN